MPLLISPRIGFLVLGAILALPFSVEAFRLSQTVMDEINVPFRRGDAPFRFLLEGVQDVDGLPEADGVDGSPCAAFLIRHNFEYRGATKTAQRLCRRIGLALLGRIKSLTDISPNFAGKTAQVFSA